MTGENLILYFSGTKNSLMVATEIEKKIKEKELGKCVKMPIFQFDSQNEIHVDTLGIVCPVYWLGLPCIICDTISNMKIRSGTYIYTVVTMGVYSGNALAEMERLLRQKNLSLSYGAAVKCPDNYSTLLGYQKTKKHNEMLRNARKTIQKIAADICEQKQNKIPKFHKSLDLLFSDYRRSLGKQEKRFVVEDRCTGCGLCQRECPVQNIRLVQGRPKWLGHCEFCISCISVCPQNAIQIGKKTKGKPRYQNPFS